MNIEKQNNNKQTLNIYDHNEKWLIKLSVDKKYKTEFENKNFSNYSKAIYLNYNNQKLLKKLFIYKYLYYLMAFLLIVSSIVETIVYPNFENKIIYAWISSNAILFFFIYIPWLTRLVFVYKKPPFHQGDRIIFIIKQYLIARYNIKNSIPYSKDQASKIAKFFYAFYFKYSDNCELPIEKNKKRIINNKNIGNKSIENKIKIVFLMLNSLIYISLIAFVSSVFLTFLLLR